MIDPPSIVATWLFNQIGNLGVGAEVRLRRARHDWFGAKGGLQLLAGEAGFPLPNSGAFGARLHRAPETYLRKTLHRPTILAT